MLKPMPKEIHDQIIEMWKSKTRIVDISKATGKSTATVSRTITKYQEEDSRYKDRLKTAVDKVLSKNMSYEDACKKYGIQPRTLKYHVKQEGSENKTGVVLDPVVANDWDNTTRLFKQLKHNVVRMIFVGSEVYVTKRPREREKLIFMEH